VRGPEDLQSMDAPVLAIVPPTAEKRWLRVRRVQQGARRPWWVRPRVAKA
jgi:hypothetical protein